MNEVKRLQGKAEKEATQNGHKLGKWRTSQYGQEFISHAYCGACYDNVMVDTRAEQVVSGSALRQRCDPDRIPF